jgi:hypothetical protein
MGGGGSKPAPAPTVIEQEPPAGSGESSIVYPDRPETPRLDGISRSLANECNGCELQVLSGISSSSVKVSREFGVVGENQCARYQRDLKRVREKKMSWQDFLNNLQSGRYLRNLNNGYCEQVELPSDEAQKVTKVEEFDEGKLRSVRIQQVSSGGFSADTKARFTPSIPFKVRFSAGNQTPTEITVKSMTLYHPCPLRLEGVQPDAVLSLNDPSFDNPNYVVLIPLVGRNMPGTSVEFLQKIIPEVVSVSEPDPSSGQYIGKDIATGANWTLSKLFTVQPSGDGNFNVVNGFYEWKGMPALERKRQDGPGTITYSWVESSTPGPRYIMLDTPVVCNPSDLAILTTRMPVTPASDAIHAVLYSSNPFQRGIVHKQGPAGASCPSSKETFADLQNVYGLTGTGTQEEEACDAWTLWAQASAGKGLTTQQIITIVYNSMVFIAMAIGAYLAFSAILRLYDVEYSEVSKNIGQITAVFAKNLQQKAAALNGALSNPRTAFLGGPMAALKGTKTGLLSNLKETVADTKSGLLSDVKETTANLEDKATSQAKKWDTVDTSAYTGTTSSRGDKGLRNRGGTLRRGRGHGGLTRRDVH